MIQEIIKEDLKISILFIRKLIDFVRMDFQLG